MLPEYMPVIGGVGSSMLKMAFQPLILNPADFVAAEKPESLAAVKKGHARASISDSSLSITFQTLFFRANAVSSPYSLQRMAGSLRSVTSPG